MTQHSALSTQHSGRLLLALAVFAATVAFGCRRDDAPPPKSISQAQVGALPLRASDVTADKNIVGPAASPEEAAKPAPAPSGGAAAGAAVTVDDTTPEGLAQGYAAVMSSLSLQQLPSMVLPDQAQKATEFVTATQEVLGAVAELKKALKEKFPDEKFTLAPVGTGLSGAPVTAGTPEVDASDANTATVTFQSEGQPEQKRTIKKIEEHWKVDESELPDAAGLAKMQPVFQKNVEVVKDLTGRLGEFADAAAFKAEYEKAIAQVAAGAAGPAPEAAPAPDAAKPKAEAKPKSELEQGVDDSVSGPALRRR